ncbi:unnamed protein product [Fusarium equiseti]|uniref:Uncharacterized protein n=1 Tax=Fusarium equiseti TaxID=61235 RepID=A0A8J2ND79_FUSEQ|nr:unnamed protein product [Fusarium equiseti]
MSAPKNEQDEAVDWDYDKMKNGVNVKFPPLDSGDVPEGYVAQELLKKLWKIWNKHSRHWDVQHKIEIINYIWDPSVAEDYPLGVTNHPLYSERSEFSAYVILKCLYPKDPDLDTHRFIRWGKYPAVDGDEHQPTDWDRNPVAYRYTSESPTAQGYQCSGADVETVNEGVRGSAQDEPNESLKTKNKVNDQRTLGGAQLSPDHGQWNNNMDTDWGFSQQAVMPVDPADKPWWPSSYSPRPDVSHWVPDGENEDRERLVYYSAYAASDSENVESEETAHQETSAENHGVYDECTNSEFSKLSVPSACPSNNVFATTAYKFSSETDASEVCVFTPASSHVEQAPALSDQQIQEMNGFITKTADDAVAHLSLDMNHLKIVHLSLEMSHMKKSLDGKIQQMREDFKLKFSKAMKVHRSLKDEMENLPPSLPESASTRQQLRELRARVADMEESIATL